MEEMMQEYQLAETYLAILDKQIYPRKYLQSLEWEEQRKVYLAFQTACFRYPGHWKDDKWEKWFNYVRRSLAKSLDLPPA